MKVCFPKIFPDSARSAKLIVCLQCVVVLHSQNEATAVHANPQMPTFSSQFVWHLDDKGQILRRKGGGSETQPQAQGFRGQRTKRWDNTCF